MSTGYTVWALGTPKTSLSLGGARLSPSGDFPGVYQRGSASWAY